MKSIMIVLAGIALCGVGALGFFKDIDFWGVWMIAGAIVIFTQVD